MIDDDENEDEDEDDVEAPSNRQSHEQGTRTVMMADWLTGPD